MVVVAPVPVVLEEVRLLVVQPDKHSVHPFHGQAEVTDRPRIALLDVIVLEHPIFPSWKGAREEFQQLVVRW